jgi:hypothetical protein
LNSTAKQIEQEMKEYAEYFLKTEYGDQASKLMKTFEIQAVDAYDTGGVSEITEKGIKIAAKRDIEVGKLTNTTKLIIRHEIGHMLDKSSPAFPEFEERIEHEKMAWANAKPKNAAEKWYKNLSIRTHLDPLKMQVMGFPRPEKKVSPSRLKQAIRIELKRMKRDSVFADQILAERFAMARLIEDPEYYRPKISS